MKQYKINENNITYDIEEQFDGDKTWYKNGKRHRENGPACEWSDGTKIWYKNGLHHRDDGPACEYANGSIDYWYNGKRLENINSYEDLLRYIKFLSIS